MVRVKVLMAGVERTYYLEVEEVDYAAAIRGQLAWLSGVEDTTGSPVHLNLAHVARLERAAS